MVMLYCTRKSDGRYCDINAEAIDSFYHRNLDFDPHSKDAKRFAEILDLLTTLLGDGKRKKVIGHEAIGLMLLVDSLFDDYTRSWISDFAHAFDSFRASIAKATKNRFSEPDEFWLGYGQFTRANTDRAETIERRHKFFAEKMRLELKPQLKDATRLFGELEREIIYHREKKKCQRCGAEVLWAEAEIHHVELHSQGGPTNLKNGALVHKHCHPKGAKETAAFTEQWKKKASELNGDGSEPISVPAKKRPLTKEEKATAKAVKSIMKLTSCTQEQAEELVRTAGELNS